MKKITIKRVSNLSCGMFGVIFDEDIPFALTCERPWVNNQKSVSCIPIGIYRCKRIISPKFGDTFEVTNVPDRTEILLHKGNINDDSHGCILVGEQFEPFQDKQVGILASAKGFEEFLKRTKGIDEFQLRIIWIE